ncbi:hypothetical protein [Brochothrix thermosphacta]|uniref:hypothetical protein n=1 Tax=Brochothrix thermosphacta TaxID=2756 RepID=UPI003F9C65A1
MASKTAIKITSKYEFLYNYQIRFIFLAINRLETNHEALMTADLKTMNEVYGRLCEKEENLEESKGKGLIATITLNDVKMHKVKLKRQIDYLTEMSR